MIVTKIHYNWFYTTGEGENYQEAEVGKKGVILIQYYHSPFEGAKECCVVKYGDGTDEVIYNLNKLFRKKDA